MGFNSKVRIALVGDAACGKTALTVKFTQNLFIDCYFPTNAVEDFSGEIDTRKGVCSLTILDTSSYNEAVRSLSYMCSNVVVVCFDLTRSESLESIEKKWVPELNKYCSGIPFIIAGCKRDEMCDSPDGCICGGTCCGDLGEDKLTDLLSRTGASAYIDCSALTDENVEAVFGVAAECVNPKRRKGAKRLVASIKKKLSRL